MQDTVCHQNDRDEQEYRNEDIQVAEPIKDKPPLYKVVMLNDDYTPMDFVILVLMEFFSMDELTATQTMLTVHEQGKAVCGLFTREISETKAYTVVKFARSNDYALKCDIEPA